MNRPFLYIIFCVLLFALQYPANAQVNLVPNGSFEEYDTCPDNNSQLYRCINWNNPTNSTPDYYNKCNQGIIAGIPNNYGGCQYPINGNGYCGIWAYWDGVEPCDYREYIQAKLNFPLERNKSYYLEFYVSLGIYTAAIKKMGALFTSYPINRNDECPIFASPQVVNSSGFLTDTLNWMKISGTFKADGGEEYITIGDFESNKTDDLLPLLPDLVTLGSYAMYYYIDGIIFTEAPSDLIIPNIFTPNNDGYNDVFEIQSTAITKFQLRIYNRWGSIIYETNDVNRYWSGDDKNGNTYSDGVYYYVITAKGSDDVEFNKKGTIQLLR